MMPVPTLRSEMPKPTPVTAEKRLTVMLIASANHLSCVPRKTSPT